MKIDATVKKETLFIMYGMLILSALMEAVYLIIGYWHISVLIANVIGAGISILNFFLMGISIQKSLNDEPEDAKRRLKVSQQFRQLLVFVVICAGASVCAFGVVSEERTLGYIIALVLPLLFNRITIAIRSINMVR